jgi:hypothetical protein
MNFKIDAKEKQKLLNSLNLIQSFVENLEDQKSCYSCKHYVDSIGGCELYMQNPPAHIKPIGCEGWVIFDDIPY